MCAKKTFIVEKEVIGLWGIGENNMKMGQGIIKTYYYIK